VTTATMNISENLIQRYSAGPSQSKIDQAKALRTAVREALGYDYRVFLQGSYRNRTGVADLNDVDIVALSETVHSTRGGPPPTNPVTWDEIFWRVEYQLGQDSRFAGRIQRADKCVRVATDLALDVVPAIYRDDPETDPIEIHSFRTSRNRDNYPRDHWSNGVDKNDVMHTDGTFKPTVRLVKRWARNVLGPNSDVAPSFYLECAAYNVPDDKFNKYLPLSFAAVGATICDWNEFKYIGTVAEDKDILVPSEWHPDKFKEFKDALIPHLGYALDSMTASTETEANRLWRRAVGE
jgi:hypothetical protein